MSSIILAARRALFALRHHAHLVRLGWLRWRLPTPREAQDRSIDTLVYIDLIARWPV